MDGRPIVVIRAGKRRLFNREHSTKQGRIVWAHRQPVKQSAYYAIYFDVSDEKHDWGIPAAPWLGDGHPQRREQGQSLGGFSHFTAAIADLNGDNLFDVVAGNEKGDVFWYPNRGRVNVPRFDGCHLLEDESGLIDTGWYAAPFATDWNSDGLVDLVVGTSGNVILWWRNEGTIRDPEFKFAGFVEADENRLEVPEKPVAEDPTGIFARDYFNQPWVGDFDGDGNVDLVTGGYTTGRIFWYRGVGRREDGVPVLTYAGELQNRNGPIDTVWGAAPALADFGTGKMDLVAGAWWWSGIHRKPLAGEMDPLWFFQRTTEGQLPRFHRASFPRRGEFPEISIPRPMMVDANGDGLLDLFVSESGGNAYVFPNVGKQAHPKWDLEVAPLSVPWGFTRDFDAAASTADVDGDGTEEVLVGNVLSSLSGAASSPQLSVMGTVHIDGKPLHHAGPGYGDPYYFSLLYDWDRDGLADILWGTQQGHVYLHRNRGTADPLEFAPGIPLRLLSGEPLRVGPPVVESADEASDFTILQGSRIVLNVADLDSDGIDDLVVGDTFANIWLFRSTASNRPDGFEAGELLLKLPTRPESIACADWNADGRIDLLIGGTATEPCIVYYNSSDPTRVSFEAGRPLKGVPYLFWGPKLRAADWNGDGDVDLLVQSEFFSFWLERSFLDHGYQQGLLRPGMAGQPIIEQRASVERLP